MYSRHDSPPGQALLVYANSQARAGRAAASQPRSRRPRSGRPVGPWCPAGRPGRDRRGGAVYAAAPKSNNACLLTGAREKFFLFIRARVSWCWNVIREPGPLRLPCTTRHDMSRWIAAIPGNKLGQRALPRCGSCCTGPAAGRACANGGGSERGRCFPPKTARGKYCRGTEAAMPNLRGADMAGRRDEGASTGRKAPAIAGMRLILPQSADEMLQPCYKGYANCQGALQ